MAWWFGSKVGEASVDGTELVSAADHSLVAMLGASPGASTAVAIMVDVLERCFSTRLKEGWTERLEAMIPSMGNR